VKYKLTITDQAQNDIEAIHDYIAIDNKQIAKKVASRIYEIIDCISLFPNIGASAKEKFGIKTNLKCFSVFPYSYLVFYQIKKDELFISNVIDGRRDCIRVLI
jgi:plasmid stabilization system protein ParE